MAIIFFLNLDIEIIFILKINMLLLYSFKFMKSHEVLNYTKNEVLVIFRSHEISRVSLYEKKI